MTIYNLRIQGEPVSGEKWENSLYFTSAGLSLDDAAAVATTFVDHLWNGNGSTIAGLKGRYDADTTVVGAVLNAISDSTGHVIGQELLTVTSTGTATGEPLPPNVALVVSLRTTAFGPGGRGRIYLPAPSTAECVGGRLASAAQTEMANVVFLCLAEAQDADFALALYHRNTRTTTAVTSIDMGDVFDGQTRRRQQLAESRVSHSLLG